MMKFIVTPNLLKSENPNRELKKKLTQSHIHDVLIDNELRTPRESLARVLSSQKLKQQLNFQI
jgi:hypothetical protein